MALMLATSFHRSQVKLDRQLIDRILCVAQLLAAHRYPGDFAVKVVQDQCVHQAVGRQRKRHRLAQQGASVKSSLTASTNGSDSTSVSFGSTSGLPASCASAVSYPMLSWIVQTQTLFKTAPALPTFFIFFSEKTHLGEGKIMKILLSGTCVCGIKISIRR